MLNYFQYKPFSFDDEPFFTENIIKRLLIKTREYSNSRGIPDLDPIHKTRDHHVLSKLQFEFFHLNQTFSHSDSCTFVNFVKFLSIFNGIK